MPSQLLLIHLRNNFIHFNCLIMEAINSVADHADGRVQKPGVLNILRCKCPRCRRGDMFTEKNPYRLNRTMRMEEQCAVCGQPFNIEVGFYYGSSYVSYAFSIAISVASLVAYWLIIGISVNDHRFFYWLIVNAVLLLALQPVLMRVARAVWLAFFVRYDKNWRINPAKQPERVNKEQQGNW